MKESAGCASPILFASIEICAWHGIDTVVLLGDALIWDCMPIAEPFFRYINCERFAQSEVVYKPCRNQEVNTSMEKNRIQPMKSGTSIRMSYARQDDVLEVRTLLKFKRTLTTGSWGKDSKRYLRTFLQLGITAISLAWNSSILSCAGMISSIPSKSVRRGMPHMPLRWRWK